jgi:uncharacterized protein
MYARLLVPPDRSFFFFGPRGTGKSTWLKQHFPHAIWYDLLDSTETLRLEREPSLLYRELCAVAPGSWVVLDEIQKVPAVMDEVHRLIEGRQLRFALCGSSARKLKRGGANLLAGRASVERMFPLISAELGADFDTDRALRRGNLPLAMAHTDPAGFLQAYAMTYLNEEIRAEALTRNLGAFSRFLEVAARQNGQVTNVTGIARDAGVGRTTVQNYFEILQDTLIGEWLFPWKLKSANKQVAHPKFYLFDPGVARALSGRAAYPPTPEELGPLLETLILGEVQAYLAYRRLHYRVHFWHTHDGAEVDFLCETSAGFVAIEVKASASWRTTFNRGLLRLRDELAGAATHGVYLGPRAAQFGHVRVHPVRDFLSQLWNHELIR